MNVVKASDTDAARRALGDPAVGLVVCYFGDSSQGAVYVQTGSHDVAKEIRKLFSDWKYSPGSQIYFFQTVEPNVDAAARALEEKLTELKFETR